MNLVEGRQLAQLAVAVVLLAGFVWLYARGGRSHRILRWLLGGLWFSLGVNLLAAWNGCWHWPMALAVLAYPASLAVGYGGVTLPQKAWRRARYGALVGASSLWFFLPVGVWWMAAVQSLYAVSASLLLGLLNPTSAVGEEGALSLLMVAVVPFMVIR